MMADFVDNPASLRERERAEKLRKDAATVK